MNQAKQTSTIRTRWWWVRHAPVRSDGGRIYGQSDLSCDCSDQVVFDALARVLPADAAWYTSHLARTRETAAAIWAAGTPAPADGAEEIRDFAEQNLGEWQGRDRVGFFASRPENPRSYWFGPASERPPGGESFADVVARTGAGMARIAPAVRGRDVVIVAHGGTIRAALAVALGLEPDVVLGFGIENCSITRLDHYDTSQGDGWRAVMVNSQPWAGVEPDARQQPAGPEAPATIA
jgi:broad specificity phosphatase PhoE